MDLLFDHIEQHYPLSSAAREALAENFEEQVLAKGKFLITEGRVCNHLYFLQQGALRGYITVDGKEQTNWFGFEEHFITSFHSFITRQPSVENIQLLEGSILWSISKAQLTRLFDKHHEIERLVRIIYEKYYIRLEERYVNAQLRTATERYEHLIRESPHIIERVPLGHISSYLGISPETLSRIRSRF
ncbi:Crp/Fnr family transcriptional regulator [Niabella drilacis]|uniref:cAMP-binding domain of CRP or a regulatory subunit of cAMP-dependent protein kinases n=1 Tax=Niabella drilacis (strain DSM 25811 / CCM 8410 / CCUG 62505 / LMG 26954 / E90) TaxID=1285928 RepID=A0A1G6KL48_NIADE|nr:Crp/Fnr family transcriptional regulator [Niabella drilacis]SDC31558.1 cAMP-binding domain of CRP or a regulatory subunit of cAMP-dependent protein kinases [Niabella drilacis]